MKTKTILMIAGGLLLVGGVYYFAVIRKRSTEDQFNRLKSSSLKTGWDILANISPAQEQNVKDKWLKNINREEADRIIELSAKKEKDMTISEKLEVTKLVNKWLRGYKN